MRYLSVCSGIEAASVAWEKLGWTPVGFAEIEPFPCEVLKQRYPHVKNYGDLTNYEQWDITPGTVDVLVGGPPCQAFSVAGLREGMADPRGNLSLLYFGLVNRIKPKWIVYENVPGLLSARGGSDFSALLSALAECGYGFAYRTLDAQHFSLAQRRQRVFIVGCRSGDWRHSAAVLFDGPSSFGHFKKGEEEGQEIAPASGVGAGSPSEQLPFGTRGNPDVAHCLETTCHDYSRADGFNMVLDGRKELPIAFKVRCGGEYTGTKGGEVKPTERGGTGMLHYEDKTFTVAATQDQFVATPVTYSIREDSSANTFHVKETDTALCVTSIRPSPMAQHAQNFIVQPQQVLYENHPNDSRVTGPHEVAPTIAARFGTGGGNVPFVQNLSPVAFQPGNLARRAGSDPSTEVFPTLSKDSGDQNPHVAVPMAVRRLTPEECEALQGFPKNHTRISWRGKSPEECPDGPRYKAIGNSMATNCMHWIGRRIQLVEDLVTELNQKQG